MDHLLLVLILHLHVLFCDCHSSYGTRMEGTPLASSPTSSPFLDAALAAVPRSSPSRRDGRSSTDIVAGQLDDGRQGYFDAGPSSRKADYSEALVKPTGIPLPSPDDLRSQETSSTDKLDKEFQDGEDLILAQAEMEIDMRPTSREEDDKTVLQERPQGTPKTMKRKRSRSSELQALPPDIADAKTATTAIDDEEDSWNYTQDAAYAASKFGGLAEYMRHKRLKLYVHVLLAYIDTDHTSLTGRFRTERLQSLVAVHSIPRYSRDWKYTYVVGCRAFSRD